MQIINHELARRVSGLRLFCIVICGICLINLVRWILAPTAEILFVNQSNDAQFDLCNINSCFYLLFK